MANGDRHAGAAKSIVDHVTKAYGDEFAAKTVVRDCSFTVANGKFTVLIGPSGCGKTTLINLIAGYERPTAGRITRRWGRTLRGRRRIDWWFSRRPRCFPG